MIGAFEVVVRHVFAYVTNRYLQCVTLEVYFQQAHEYHGAGEVCEHVAHHHQMKKCEA